MVAATLGTLALSTNPAGAQTADPERLESAPSIIVTGSVVSRRVDEAPYSISTVGRDELRGAGPMMNLSEASVRVPGLTINNRSNFAQDLQIASRGFGSRATFGVRGIRLYADGIPTSGPDGQGQVSHMDIAAASRVEVLRGPFSVLYGNGSGGVISIFTAPVKGSEWEVTADVGGHGLRQARASAAARLGGGWDARASLSDASMEGFRPQSAADKRQAQARLGWAGERDQVSFTLNALDQPAQDPLGLTRVQFLLGPGEMAYRTDGTGGFNSALRAQRSDQAKAGLRWRGEALRADLTAFAIRTRDEIDVATNSAGRSAFQNVGRTAREGLEFSGDAAVASPWSLQWATNMLRARYSDGFLTCAAIPCTTPTAAVAAGNHITGAVPAQAWASLSWLGGYWGVWGLEMRSVGGYFANDRNTLSAAVAGHNVAALRWSKTVRIRSTGPQLEWLVRVDNLTNRRYAGSVIVNDANERYFEPGAPRSLLMSLRLLDAF